MHRTPSWRNCLYVCLYVKKKALRIRFLPVALPFYLQGTVWGKDHSKSKVQKKQWKDLGKTDTIWKTQFPGWLNETAFPLPSVYSTAQCLADTFSSSLGRSRTTWRRMEENAPAFITERPHTHMLSYLDNVCVVLQGWEHSTSALLGKDAKCVQVRH